MLATKLLSPLFEKAFAIYTNELEKTHYETSEESYENNMEKRIMPRRMMEYTNPSERYRKRMTGKHHEHRKKAVSVIPSGLKM